MCGTSQDGLDLADVSFEPNLDGTWRFEVHATSSMELGVELKSKLQKARELTGLELVRLDREVAQFFAQSVNDFAVESKGALRYVASHGVTIFHDASRGFSVQIGSGAVIAAQTGLATICDFRQQDISLGGQGAPLVPSCDARLFSDYDYTLNLGGFANVSVLTTPPRGWDICGCNLLLNMLSQEVGQAFDQDGKMAQQGSVHKGLLSALEHTEYFDADHAKSLGVEWLEAHVVPILLSHNNLPLADRMCTTVEFIAKRIGHSFSHGRVLLTGGGAHNTFLVERIRFYSKAELIVPSKELIDFREAICFAFLGALRILEIPNILHSSTGSSADHCAGALYLPMQNDRLERQE
jgi:anhydro-N-acetylmuramic acid kinase